MQKFTLAGAFVGSIEEAGGVPFSTPQGVAVDSAHNLYVADSGNNRIVKLDASGDLLASWGEWGEGDEQFAGPCGVAVDASGRVFVADTYNYRVVAYCPTPEIMRATYAGKLLTIYGGGFGDAPTILVNGVDRTSRLKASTAGSLTLKGSPAKLGLVSGNNTIQVAGDGGAMTNTFTLAY